MEAILHERQEGSLCAQHCLNTLLQGQYFTAVDLAEIAKQLDETERQTMAEAGELTPEYRTFLQQPSSNFDDSGFFSIQVIQNALQVWNIELVPFTSTNEVAVAARQDPVRQVAYICNFKEHWFCIRKLGNQWFNLNSLLTGPELVSDTFLAMLLKQLQNEGYSIFVVLGSLPECEADQVLRLVPAHQPVKPRLITDTSEQGQAGTSGSRPQEDTYEEALRASRREQEESEQAELEAAIALSMQASTSSEPEAGSSESTTLGGSPNTQLTNEELRNRRLAFLSKAETSTGISGCRDSETHSPGNPGQSGMRRSLENRSANRAVSEMTEEEMLEAAIRLSQEET